MPVITAANIKAVCKLNVSKNITIDNCVLLLRRGYSSNILCPDSVPHLA